MRLFSVCLLMLLYSVAPGAAETIMLYNYQNKPPYVLSSTSEKGLYFDLAEKLSAAMPNYRFEVQEIPRKRLDRLLATGQMKGLVIGANPAWFPGTQRAQWSAPFIDDANLLISRDSGSVSRLTLEKLGGKRIGVIGGHRYPELEGLIHARPVILQEGISEKINLELLQRGRIDATIVGVRTMDYFRRHKPELGRHLYVLEAPLYRYERRLLIPARYTKLTSDLNRAIESLGQDIQWQRQVNSYR